MAALFVTFAGGLLLECYLTEATALAPKLRGAEQAHWYNYLSAEYENIRAVLQWSLHLQIEWGMQLAARLWRFWQVKGYALDMLGWFEEALPMAGQVSPATQAEAYNAAGIMARTCGRYERSFSYLEQALAFWRALADRGGEAIALNNLAVSARDVEELSWAMGQPAFVQARHKGRRDSLQEAYRQILGGFLDGPG